ncbi:MAG: hypothetical protein AMXMBFR12_07890 [Candidatus Babeliales bacterium]
MKYIKTAQKSLYVSILGAFLASGSLCQAMETYVAMNEGKTAFLPPQNSVTFKTDQLEGCVVILLNLEHSNRYKTTAMTHFSHDKKSYNKDYLKNLFAHLAQANQIETIQKAFCIIIPPGIKNGNQLEPILDKEWKDLIVETIRTAIPSITIQVKPYLFNIGKSAVEYCVANNRSKITIINKSHQEDLENHDQLLVSHSYKHVSFCQRWAPLLVAMGGITAYFISQLN